jgi:hypothetical protein
MNCFAVSRPLYFFIAAHTSSLTGLPSASIALRILASDVAHRRGLEV